MTGISPSPLEGTMTRRTTRALALLTLLGSWLLAASPALAARERLVFVAVPLEDNCGCSPFLLGELDLFDRASQPQGALNLFGFPTSPPDVPDEDASGIVTMVASLDGGSIVAQGVFPLDDGPAIIAIVGGTGRFKRTRGYVRAVPRPNGNVRVVMHLIS
jgi:hypothetical protein